MGPTTCVTITVLTAFLIRVVFGSIHELEFDSCTGENRATGIQWMKGRETNDLPVVEVMHNEDKKEILISYLTWQIPGHS